MKTITIHCNRINEQKTTVSYRPAEKTFGPSEKLKKTASVIIDHEAMTITVPVSMIERREEKQIQKAKARFQKTELSPLQSTKLVLLTLASRSQDPATEKQCWYLAKLLVEAGKGADEVGDITDNRVALSKVAASNFIEDLLA